MLYRVSTVWNPEGVARALHSTGLGLVAGVVLALGAAGVAEARTIHGVVFADANGDGQQGPGELGVAGAIVAYDVTVFTTADATGQFDLVVPDGATGNAWVRVPDGYVPGPVWGSVAAATTLAFGLRPAAPRTGPLTFVVASDSHIAPDQPFASDLAAAAKHATALTPAPAFLAITGDITQGNSDQEFDMIQAQLGDLGVPFISVPGNHDWYDGGATWHHRFGPDNYSFDIGTVHFVVWNMSLSDAGIQAYLAAELAHVDPAMTVVAFSHAPPAPDTIATLRTAGVDYVITGHTHTNRVIDHGGMLEINSEPMLMGGLDFTPAGYRVITLDAGKLRSYHRTVVDQPFLQLMSPALGQCVAPDGDEAFAAAEIDASPLTVTATIDGGAPIPAVTHGGWAFSVALPALAAGTHTLDVVATSASGTSTHQTTQVEVCTRDTPPMPTSEWLQLGGGASHSNAVATTLVPPLVPRWTQQVGGHVLQAAPVIASGMVIQTATDLGDDTTGGIVALDLATGAQVWRTPAHARGGVAVAGSVVIVAQIDGSVLGLDLMSGMVLWTTPLGEGIRSEAAYINAPPTVDDGDVFIGNEHAFAAIDATTGARSWVEDPIAKPYDFSTDDAMVVGGGLVIGSFARSTGLTAWDRDTGAQVWQLTNDQTTGVNGSPVIVDNTLYVVDAADEVSALDLGTGTVQWKVQLDPQGFTWGNAIAGTPAVSGHVIVVPTLYGDLVGLDIAGGRQLWRHGTQPSPIRTTHYRGAGMAGYEASPVITGTAVWAADTAGVVVALDLETGRELWRTPLGAPVLASLAVADGWLVASTYDGTVHAWSLPYGAPVADPLEIGGGGCCDTGGRGHGGLGLGAVVALALRRRRRR